MNNSKHQELVGFYFGDQEFRSSLDNSMRRAAFRVLRKRHGIKD